MDVYNELVKLRHDPVAFEKRRQEILDAELKDDVKRKQLQWQIEGELRKFKNPVARYNKMIELFWSGFSTFNNTLKGFGGVD